MGLNPLHCGAVVASPLAARRGRAKEKKVSIPFIAGQWSLQEHGVCDAVFLDEVSIPFIAGQWSLLADDAALARWLARRSQSPSLRGSGRFDGTPSPPAGGGDVSIPFIAGQWSLPLAVWRGAGRNKQVSIPFIAGQWSLRADLAEVRADVARLNPLHCGAVVASLGRLLTFC